MIGECDEAIEELEDFAQWSEDKPIDIEPFRVVRHMASEALDEVRRALSAGERIDSGIVDSVADYLREERMEYDNQRFLPAEF